MTQHALQGSDIYLTATIKDRAGANTDTIAQVGHVRTPTGQVYTLPPFTHVSPGVYQLKFLCEQAGEYVFDIDTTGDSAAAEIVVIVNRRRIHHPVTDQTLVGSSAILAPRAVTAGPGAITPSGTGNIIGSPGSLGGTV